MSGHGAGVDDLFAALADPTRRRLLDRLAADGPLSATQLAPEHGMTRQAVVKHLGVLEAAGVVTRQRCGREVLYGVVDGRLDEAGLWLREVGRRWDRRLAALGDELGAG